MPNFNKAAVGGQETFISRYYSLGNGEYHQGRPDCIRWYILFSGSPYPDPGVCHSIVRKCGQHNHHQY